MIESWFPTLIYSTVLEELGHYNQHLVDLAWSIKSKNPTVSTDWRCDTYNTLGIYDALNSKDIVVKKIIDAAGKNVLFFAKTYGISSGIAVCKDFWFNIAEPGAHQEYHQHANSHFSLAYYIDVKPNSGNIVFKSPEASTDMYPLPLNSKEHNPANFKTCHYSPVNNKIIIFRSNLLHMVEKNLSNSPRIGISMNFNIERN